MGQFELRRLYIHGRSLVRLVKTRAFGMTPFGNIVVEMKLTHCLPVDYDTILNLRVLVLGEDVPRNQLVSVGVGPFGDDAIGLVGGDARKRSQIILGTLVQVQGAAVAQSIFYAFGDGLGVTLDGRGLFRGFLAKLIRTLIRAGRTQGKKRCHRRGEEQ